MRERRNWLLNLDFLLLGSGRWSWSIEPQPSRCATLEVVANLEYGVFDPDYACFQPIESRVHLLKPTIYLFESMVDLLKSMINLLETAVDLLKPAIDALFHAKDHVEKQDLIFGFRWCRHSFGLHGAP